MEKVDEKKHFADPMKKTSDYILVSYNFFWTSLMDSFMPSQACHYLPWHIGFTAADQIIAFKGSNAARLHRLTFHQKQLFCNPDRGTVI